MFCNKCGNLLEESDHFCSMCGNIIQRISKENSNETNGQIHDKKSKLYITILSVMLFLSIALNVMQIVSENGIQFNTKVDNTPKSSQKAYESIVDTAITALSNKWIEIYSEEGKDDGYLEILHTRFVDITPDMDDSVFQEIDRATEIDYIVEFILYSDYFNAAPYYHNATIYDTVVVYNDGTSLVAGNLFRTYSSLTYSYDYSGFITEIADLGSTYNQQIKLTAVR